MNTETIEHMRADIQVRILDRTAGEVTDPSLLPELLQKVLTEITAVASGATIKVDPFLLIDCSANPMGLWAEALLCDLHQRAITGIPFGEPREPRFWDTLDTDERGGW